MKDEIITINTKALIISRDKAGELTLTPEAGKEIEKILFVKALIEDIYAHVQDKLSEEMELRGLQKIKAGKVSVVRRYYGEKFEIRDKDIVDEKFTKEVVWIKANSEEIEKYIQETGEVPTGVGKKDRQEKATITLKDEN